MLFLLLMFCNVSSCFTFELDFVEGLNFNIKAIILCMTYERPISLNYLLSSLITVTVETTYS